MIDRPQLHVIKFGGAVLGGAPDVRRAARDVRWRARGGAHVLVVVSALRGETDRLLEQATARGLRGAELARELARGEEDCAALMRDAIEAAGPSCALLSVDAVGPRTSGDPLDADPVSLDTDAVHAALARDTVAVLPGFVGRDAEGAVSVLGRGGSDLTALFVATELEAESCRLVKAIPGLYEEGGARRVVQVSPADLRAGWPGLVQEKALAFAEARGAAFALGSLGSENETSVEAGPRLTSDDAEAAPGRPGAGER